MKSNYQVWFKNGLFIIRFISKFHALTEAIALFALMIVFLLLFAL